LVGHGDFPSQDPLAKNFFCDRRPSAFIAAAPFPFPPPLPMFFFPLCTTKRAHMNFLPFSCAPWVSFFGGRRFHFPPLSWKRKPPLSIHVSSLDVRLFPPWKDEVVDRSPPPLEDFQASTSFFPGRLSRPRPMNGFPLLDLFDERLFLWDAHGLPTMRFSRRDVFSGDGDSQRRNKRHSNEGFLPR